MAARTWMLRARLRAVLARYENAHAVMAKAFHFEPYLGPMEVSSALDAAPIIVPYVAKAMWEVRAWSWVVPYRRNRALMCNLGRV